MSQAAAKCARWSSWGRDGVSFTFTCCVCPRFSLLFFFSFPLFLSLAKMKSHSLYSTLFAFGPLWKMNRIKFYESVFFCVRVSVRIYIMRNFHFFFSRVVAFIFCVLALHPIRDHSHTPSPSSTRAEGRDGSVRETRIFIHSLISQEIVAQFIYFVLLLLASLFSLFI